MPIVVNQLITVVIGLNIQLVISKKKQKKEEKFLELTSRQKIDKLNSN